MMFWALVAGLALAAAGALLVPLWRHGDRAAGDAAPDHLRRLDELEEDVTAGEIDAEAAAEARMEIERAVVDAVAHEPPPAHSGGRGLLALVVIAALLAAVPLYRELGAPRVAEFALRNPQLDLAEPRDSLEFLLEEVRHETRRDPADREAWEVLARSTLRLGRYEEALAAAERVHALAPDDVGGMLLLIDALTMREGGRVGARAQRLWDPLESTCRHASLSIL